MEINDLLKENHHFGRVLVNFGAKLGLLQDHFGKLVPMSRNRELREGFKNPSHRNRP